jgi:Kelch motif
MTTARTGQSATLLPNGQVLVAGGYNPSNSYLASAELYNPATGTFSATGSMTTARIGQTGTLLSIGEVLVAGGGNSSGYQASAELYNPATGIFSATGSMITAQFAPATLLPNGQVLVAGGNSPSGPTASAELYLYTNVPTSKDQCKNNGWMTLTRPDGSSFKNQGDCIQFVNTGK